MKAGQTTRKAFRQAMVAARVQVLHGIAAMDDNMTSMEKRAAALFKTNCQVPDILAARLSPFCGHGRFHPCRSYPLSRWARK